MRDLSRYRPWFYAAAVYNFVWGSIVTLYPNLYFQWLGMQVPNYPQLFQAIGMIVGVYAIGYWLVARDPDRYGPFVYVGLAGKLFGPVGFIEAAIRGQLPWSFGVINITNDLIWLPVFVVFSINVYRNERTRKSDYVRKV